MTLDGRGEGRRPRYGVGQGTDLERLGQVDMPAFAGLLYEQVTDYLGFLHSSDEYKVMALASFGKPRLPGRVPRASSDWAATASTRIEPLDLEERFGPAAAARRAARAAPLRHRPFAAGSRWRRRCWSWPAGCTTRPAPRTCAMAGGVALNCVMNARLRDRGPFKQIWVQPAAGDAGTALGAALWIDAAAARHGASGRTAWTTPSSGPRYGDEEIEEFLRWSKLPYRRLTNVAEETADLLAAGQDHRLVPGPAWSSARAPWAPARSSPRRIHADMQARLNEIKDREDFRPGAPRSCWRRRRAPNWFDGARACRPSCSSSTTCCRSKADRIPAVRHVDGTARIQTINRGEPAPTTTCSQAFQRRTGVPVLVNTSFNTRGEPIVCTPRDAVECFWTSPLDALVIGSFLLEKPGRGHDDPRFRSSCRPTAGRTCCALPGGAAAQDFDPASYEIIVADDAGSRATAGRWSERRAGRARPGGALRAGDGTPRAGRGAQRRLAAGAGRDHRLHRRRLPARPAAGSRAGLAAFERRGRGRVRAGSSCRCRRRRPTTSSTPPGSSRRRVRHRQLLLPARSARTRSAASTSGSRRLARGQRPLLHSARRPDSVGRSRRRGRASTPARPLGRQPPAAAQEHVQRPALQEAPRLYRGGSSQSALARLLVRSPRSPGPCGGGGRACPAAAVAFALLARLLGGIRIRRLRTSRRWAHVAEWSSFRQSFRLWPCSGVWRVQSAPAPPFSSR